MILDLGDSHTSELPFRTTTFPDGQPHLSLDREALARAIESGYVAIVTRLRSAIDVVTLGLAVDAVQSAFGGTRPKLTVHIAYMLGARMDRRIDVGQPDTLRVLAAMLLAATRGADLVEVLDPHSPVTLQHLPGARAMVPDRFVAYALEHIEATCGARPVVVVPDKGAIERTLGILGRIGTGHDVARCSKKRDPHTGALSGFHLDEGSVAGKDAVIVDDICDGGGTFAGIAAVLKDAGAKRVFLAVTHGVFSKGIELESVDCLYTTDSYGVPDAKDCDVMRAEAHGEPLRVYVREGEVRLVLMTEFVARTVRAHVA